MQYKEGPHNVQPIRRRRPKNSTTDLQSSNKEEVRQLIYNMYKVS
jgi:hypothetical protein